MEEFPVQNIKTGWHWGGLAFKYGRIPKKACYKLFYMQLCFPALVVKIGGVPLYDGVC